MSSNEIRNGIVAGLVMLAIAGALVLTGVLMGAHRKKVATTYPTTQALATKRSESTRSVESGLTPRSEQSTTFKYELEYTVDDITYRTRKKSRWDPDVHTTVYYNPDNPKKVYTEEQAIGGYSSAWYIIGGIIGGLGLSVFIFVLTQIGKAGSQQG